MVKRLRRSPLKAESGVRFSVGLPKQNTTHRVVFCFGKFYPTNRLRSDALTDYPRRT